LTQPLGAAGAAAIANVGISAVKPHLMELRRQRYVKVLETPPFVMEEGPLKARFEPAVRNGRNFVKNLVRSALVDPDKEGFMTDAARVREVFHKTPMQMAGSAVKSALIAGGLAYAAKRLHAKALMGEVIQEHELSRQHDPSEYIRTKLREDPGLKKQGEIMDETARKILTGLAQVLNEKTASWMEDSTKTATNAEIISQGLKSVGTGLKGMGKDVASNVAARAKAAPSQVGRFYRDQALNAVGKGEVGAMRNIGPNVERINNKGRALRAQLTGVGVIGGSAAVVGGGPLLAEKAIMRKKEQEKEAAKMSKEEFMEKFKKKKEGKAEEKKEKTAGLLSAGVGLAGTASKAIAPISDAMSMLSSGKKLLTPPK
jgi:hypothetical protein